MPAALVLSVLALVVVLGLAGLAKLSAPGATADMVRALRLPAPVRPRMVERVLPWTELGAAVLLLSPWVSTYAVGAAAALLLCLAFTAVVAHALRLDPRPDCACFGRVGDHRITARTLVRNLLLVGLAATATVGAALGHTAWGLMRAFAGSDWWWLTTALVVCAVAALALGGTAAPARPRTESVLAAAPGRSRAPAQDRAPGEPGHRPGWVAVPLPDAPLVDRDLDVVTLRSLGLSGPQVLVLVTCWCGPTFEVLGRLPGWRREHPGTGVHLVHTEPPWSEPRVAGVTDVWWDPAGRLHASLGAGWRPAGVLVDADGVVAGPVTGVEEIETLLGYSASRSRTT
ncbi:MauE/DoxX family redox-associated membrane protein [Serinicoccus sediminis]|uniref:MauE/DoxX family redox-associated membrane protein n=1 Tax=Serinicoccus sediminis TaxID=2306021 RepID=UPI0010210C3D|nr:MauE/DoxX family redox-associated membrane protein [Serinicoccus sediminis]